MTLRERPESECGILASVQGRTVSDDEDEQVGGGQDGTAQQDGCRRRLGKVKKKLHKTRVYRLDCDSTNNTG